MHLLVLVMYIFFRNVIAFKLKEHNNLFEKKNADISVQTTAKMKKSQIHASVNKSVLTSPSNYSKLKTEINCLKEELAKKTEQFNNDVLEYNLKVNQLEFIIENKNSEHSAEIIKHLRKISELEEKLRNKEISGEKKNVELIHKADELQKYKLKVNELNSNIKNLEHERQTSASKIEERLVLLEQIMENKSDRILQCLEDLLIALKIKDIKTNSCMEFKTPAAMESLIKLLQKSEEQCENLQDQNFKLQKQYTAAVQEAKVLKPLLYKNIILRYNFHMYIAKMFEAALSGLLVDLKAALPHFTNDTKPSTTECVLQIQNLTIECNKYGDMIRDLETFIKHFDEPISDADNNINLNIDNIPEFKGIQIPVSILHIKYLPMFDVLRQQIKTNLYRVQMNFPHHQFNGYPLNYLPYTNNVPRLLYDAPQMPYNNNSVSLLGLSDQNINSTLIQELNPANLGKVEEKCTFNESTSENGDSINILPKTEDPNNCSQDGNDTKLVLNKIKPFKLCSKTKAFIPAKYFSQKSTDTHTKVEIRKSADEILETRQEMSSPTKYSLAKVECKDRISISNEFTSLIANTDIKQEAPTHIFNSSFGNNSLDFINPNLPVDKNETNHIDRQNDLLVNQNASVTERVKMEKEDDADIGIVQQLGCNNSLVKLYFYLKNRTDQVDMINVSDEELVNALLRVKRNNTLKGMRKIDILSMVLADVKKQKEIVESSIDTSNTNKFCAICFDSNDEPSKTLHCQHTFHNTCLERWFQKDNICPICRKLVVSVDDLN